jgi:Asp/Glu/hydantoin racemase
MPQTLALIHTSVVFLVRETLMQGLFDEIMPHVRLINIMDDSLLPTVMAEQQVSPALTQRICSYVVGAEAAGADAVLSLCSSVGPAIDVARRVVRIPVIKIDDAHTEKAVREATKIGVVATAATTLRPTVALIHEKAAALKKQVRIEEMLAKSAFEALMSGDMQKHDQTLLAACRRLAHRVDLILFAQASMTRLAPMVEQEIRLPVLTSPRLAIEQVKRVLDGLKSRK